ncbi:HAUS augmin-like complex subunit 8 isoform X2 [Diceros bicornis minor]|uniref:HAUS augmin-like complex subunit 8 isoform X2 n=1 Tax=Diceros bicornis minor TaxID=77932 RepID=UPI0026F215F8|nr:HAUS augmin-like complex subunit 8 isoform X2 [Diceros bicornis minor]
MADSSGRGAGKPSSGGPGTPSGTRTKGRRAQGGRVVESRYLQYEKKPTKKASAADALKTSGKMPEGGRKPHPLHKSKDGCRLGKGDLQSTLLEGHGTAPPDLDLSAINDKTMMRKTPQLEKTVSKKTESTSFSASRKKSPDLSEAMEMMESQTLLLTLLTVKMENSLALFEEKAERNLLVMCEEKEKLQRKAHELKRKRLLCQRKRELEGILDAQMEMLSPYQAVAERFKEQYKTFATALDATRHELSVRSVHMDGDGQRFLDDLQRELTTTHHLLGELGISSSEENGKVLDLLSELKELTRKKDLELRRSFAQVLELSAEVSKEAALTNQEVWEEVQGPTAPTQWYFNQEGACGETQDEGRGPLLYSNDEPRAQ